MLSMYRDAEGQTVVDIKDCETMREVKILKMGSLGLTDFDVQMFSQLTNIEEMDISDNQLDTIPDSVQLPKLRRLNCSNNRFSDLQFVRQFPILEEINTDGNQVTFSDFCIAKYLCPSLKRFNDQTIDIVPLNRRVETRVKPMIVKVWNNHVKQLYEHTMDDSEFQTIADKFRMLLKHVILPMTKTISKFHDFRASILIEDFLSKVRDGSLEEDIEFGGSADSVKKNYAKRKKEEATSDQQIENEEVTEEQSGTGAVVVAVADEEGNGVLTVDDVTTILTEDQLKETSTVTIFVENVDVVPETESNQAEKEPTKTEEESSKMELEEVKKTEDTVRETSVQENTKKDFIDIETERIKKALEVAKSNDGVSRVTSLENSKRVTNIEERLKTKNRLPVPLDDGRNGDEKKVVRYWMYEGPKPKSLPSSPETVISTSKSLRKKENNPVNLTPISTTSVRSSRGRPYSRYSEEVRAEVISKLMSDGSFPTFPKMKVPTIEAEHAAMVVSEMHSAPMVVYRGRCKRGSSNSYAMKSLTMKQTVKNEITVIDSIPTATEPTKTPIVYQTRYANKRLSNLKDSDSPETMSELDVDLDGKDSESSERINDAESRSQDDKSALNPESELKDVPNDSQKCPPKKRVRFSDQNKDSNVL